MAYFASTGPGAHVKANNIMNFTQDILAKNLAASARTQEAQTWPHVDFPERQ